MSLLEKEKITRIKVLLKSRPKGLTITDISTQLKLNRNSVAKYLESLLISGQVEAQTFGTARVFTLSHRLPISALVSINADPVVTLDEHYHILFVNEIFCQMFSVKKEDVIGNHIIEIVKNGICSDTLPNIFADVIADQERVHDFHMETPNGEFFFKIKSIKTVFDDGTRGLTIVLEDITQEKKDQIELEAKEARYRGIVEDQTDFIIRFDSFGNLTFVNAAFSQYLGKSPGDLIKTRLADSFCDLSRDIFLRELASLTIHYPVTAFECQSSPIPGRLRWLAWTVRALYHGSSSASVEYQAVGKDITEKKEAEENLHRYITQMEFLSRKMQQFIELPQGADIFYEIGRGCTEIFADAVIVVNQYGPKTTTLTIRAVFPDEDHQFISRMLGRDPVGMILPVGGDPPPEVFFTGSICPAPADLKNLFFQQFPDKDCAGIEESLNLGGIYSLGIVWQGKPLGNITFALRKGHNLTNESLMEMYLRVASISLKRHLAEADLVESEYLYRTVLENIQDVYYRSDLAGNLIMASPSAAPMMGYGSIDEILGKNIAEDYYMEPEKRKEFMQAISLSGSVTDYEIVLKKKDGKPLYISTNSHFYYGRDGKVLGVEGLFRDISERRAINQRIQQYITEMEFLSQKLLEFIAMNPSDNIFDKIAGDLSSLAPGSMILVNSFDTKNSIVTVESAVMSDRQKESIARAIGHDIIGTGFPIDTPGLAAFRSGKFTFADLPLHDIVFRAMPEPACKILERELGFGKVYCIGFVHHGEVMGNAGLFLQPGGSIPNASLIEMYAREVSIALQRYRAEEARRKSDEIFYNIAQTSPLPIALIEPDGNYRYVNESFTRLFGYSLDDFHTGKEWFRLIYPDPAMRKKIIALWKTDLETTKKGTPRTRTFPVRCRDATVKEVIFRPVTLSDGKECVIYEDITERKKAMHTHRLLSSIVESTGDSVIGKDLQGSVISWNRAAERLYGYSSEEVIGKNISQIIPPGREKELDGICARIRRGRSITNLETQRVRKDKKLIDVSLTISPIVDDTGTVIGASTIARDITSQLAEGRLRENEEHYRALVENISVGVYRSTGDPAGHFVWGNSSLMKLLGYSTLDSLQGITIADLFIEQNGRKKLLDDLKKQGFVKNREIVLKRPDGSTITVLVTALARFDSEGKLSFINGIVEDISGQRQAEQQVEGVLHEVQDILAFMPDPMLIVDSNNRIMAWNPAMEQLTGVPARNITGSTDYARFLPFHNPRHPFLLELLHENDSIDRFYPGIRREGSTIIASVSLPDRAAGQEQVYTIRVSPLTDPMSGETGGIAIIHPDSFTAAGGAQPPGISKTPVGR